MIPNFDNGSRQREIAMRYGILAIALFLASATSAAAQVQGMCVSGCNIPNPVTQQPQQPAQPDPNILIGITAHVEGDVAFYRPDGTRIEPSPGGNTPVMHNARIVTGPGGSARFLLIDGTGFTVGANSEMVMDDFVYEASTGIMQVSARFMRGVFRWITGKVARKDPESMKVHLNVGVLGIRGTDFEIFAEPWGEGRVVLHEGELQFREYDTDRLIIIRAGQTLRWENFQFVGVE